MRSYAPRVSQAPTPSRSPEREVSFAPELSSGRLEPRGERRGPAGKPPANHTGIPDAMKENLERASGVDLSNLRVERNSPKPAALQASAYLQGNRIYLGPGQEERLPHEAWHAVQQRQERIQPTFFHRFLRINDNPRLEREAETLGRTVGVEGRTAGLPRDPRVAAAPPALGAAADPLVIQRSLLNIQSDEPDSPASAIKKALGVPANRLGLPASDRQPASEQLRPKKVAAEIKPDTLRADERKNAAVLSKVTTMARAEQFLLEGYDPLAFYDAGHLAADQLVGGKDDSFELWNLAPQISALNAPTYAHVLEQEVRLAAAAGETVDLQVEVEYPSDSYTVTVRDLSRRRVIGGLETPDGKLALGLRTFPLDTPIAIPRRIPSRWTATAEIRNPDGRFPSVDKPAGRGDLAENFAPDLTQVAPNLGKPFYFNVNNAALMAQVLTLAETRRREFAAVQRLPTQVPTALDVFSLLERRLPDLSFDMLEAMMAEKRASASAAAPPPFLSPLVPLFPDAPLGPPPLLAPLLPFLPPPPLVAAASAGPASSSPSPAALPPFPGPGLVPLFPPPLAAASPAAFLPAPKPAKKPKDVPKAKPKGAGKRKTTASVAVPAPPPVPAALGAPVASKRRRRKSSDDSSSTRPDDA